MRNRVPLKRDELTEGNLIVSDREVCSGKHQQCFPLTVRILTTSITKINLLKNNIYTIEIYLTADTSIVPAYTTNF